MSAGLEELFGRVSLHARQTAVLESVNSVLGWDERTMMPAAAGEFRAEQMTLLAGLIHQRWTSPEFGEWLAALETGPLAADRHSDAGTTIRRLMRQREKRIKLPQRLVEELTHAAVVGQQVWQQARQDDRFAAFRPALERIVALKREQADALGYEACRYDALLDEFEPEERTAEVAAVLARLRDALVPLVSEIGGSGRKPDASILARSFPVERQEAFGREAAARIGFDFGRGRLDVTTHPFCSGLGPNDCRITTRYDEHAPAMSLFGVLHEAGHGIYEQGLRVDHYGLPPGEAVSLGIHESQSRLWENFVGRSRAFWDFLYARAQEAFPAALADVPLEAFHFAINEVRPSLVRVEADEATYNLHILVRFELEQAMLDGELPVAELPSAWNEKYAEYLGVRPPNDRLGVLQDIHWSGGAIGYFPTYSLGNLYAAQFFAQADADLGGLAELFVRGDFAPLCQWLREKIHRHGQCYTAAELVERITGKRLGHEALVRHLREKLRPLYGLT
jgi:carboxypeptidase Taq